MKRLNDTVTRPDYGVGKRPVVGWLSRAKGICIRAVTIIPLVSVLSVCSPRNSIEQTPTRVAPVSSTPIGTYEIASPATSVSGSRTAEATPVPVASTTPGRKTTVDSTLPEPELKTPLPTQTPSPTATGEPTDRVTVIAEGEKIGAVMIFQDQGGILLLSPDGNPIGEIPLHPIAVAWSADGCQLQVTMPIGEATHLYDIDLNGNILQDELFVGGYNSIGGWRTWPVLSPGGKWISYVVWSGDFFYSGAEYQDIEVVAADDQDEPFRLTERGGAWERGAVWSPDGERLAYSHFDDAGIAQLFHSRPDGSDLRQLTWFTTPDLRVGAIAWSTDGNLLAFGTYYGDGLGGLWVVSQDGTGLRSMVLDESSPLRENWLLWSHDSKILVAATRGYVPSDGLYWFDAHTGEVLHSFQSPKAIAFPFHIAGVQSVGFLGGDGILYRYDFEDGSLNQWADFELLSTGLIQQIISHPNGPIDISVCHQD